MTANFDIFDYVPSLLRPNEFKPTTIGCSQLTQKSLRLAKSSNLHQPAKALSTISELKNANPIQRCSQCLAPDWIFQTTDIFHAHQNCCRNFKNTGRLCENSTECSVSNIFHYKIYRHTPTANEARAILLNSNKKTEIDAVIIKNEHEEMVENCVAEYKPDINQKEFCNETTQRFETSSGSSIFQQKPKFAVRRYLSISKNHKSPQKKKHKISQQITSDIFSDITQIKHNTESKQQETQIRNDSERRRPVINNSLLVTNFKVDDFLNANFSSTIPQTDLIKTESSLNVNEIEYTESESSDSDTSYIPFRRTRRFFEELAELATRHSLKNNLNIMHESSSSSEYSDLDIRAPKCPSYKILKGTPIAVDAFAYGSIPGVSVYLLTHFSAKAVAGLSTKFPHKIYCSSITANLLNVIFKIPLCHCVILDVLTPSSTNDGYEITAYDANYCPGSLMFHVRNQNGVNIFYIAAFRATPYMESLPCFWNFDTHRLYLDTTFCSPDYEFPSQDECLQMIADETIKHTKLYSDLLIVCSRHIIGSEIVWSHIAKKLGCNVWVDEKYRAKIFCLENPYLKSILCEHKIEGQVHVLPKHQVHFKYLKTYLENLRGSFQYLLALHLNVSKWKHKPQPITKDKITILYVPFSQHSSFSELSRFVRFVKPKRIIPIVETKVSPHAMQNLFKDWILDNVTNCYQAK